MSDANPGGQGGWIAFTVLFLLNIAGDYLKRVMPPPKHHNHNDLACDEIEQMINGAHVDDEEEEP